MNELDKKIKNYVKKIIKELKYDNRVDLTPIGLENIIKRFILEQS